MSYSNSKLLWSLVLISLAVLAGCGSPAPSTTPASSNADVAAQPAARAADAETEQALAALSPEDQAVARKQKVCPVTGEALGSMGTPYKTTVKGRTVFLCCSGCEEEVQKNADKYLAKIDAAAK
jgi:YHS domain-containing protein/predicted small lipoprotein YifL